MFWDLAMTGDQPCNFGNELDPLARYHRDRLDRADRNTIAAAGAGSGIDDGAQLLAGEDADGGAIADFRAAAAVDAMPLDAGVCSGEGRQQAQARLVRTRQIFGFARCEGKNGSKKRASRHRQRHVPHAAKSALQPLAGPLPMEQIRADAVVGGVAEHTLGSARQSALR